MTRVAISILILLLIPTESLGMAQPYAQQDKRILGGIILSQQGELVPSVAVVVSSSVGEQRAVSDLQGRFNLTVPNLSLSVRFEGRNIKTVEKAFGVDDRIDDLEIRVTYIVPTIHESVVIEASSLEPGIDRRNDTVYKSTLFNRDDFIFFTKTDAAYLI